MTWILRLVPVSQEITPPPPRAIFSRNAKMQATYSPTPNKKLHTTALGWMPFIFNTFVHNRYTWVFFEKTSNMKKT